MSISAIVLTADGMITVPCWNHPRLLLSVWDHFFHCGSQASRPPECSIAVNGLWHGGCCMVRDAWSPLRVPLSVPLSLFLGIVQFTQIIWRTSAGRSKPWQHCTLISGVFHSPGFASAVVDRDRRVSPIGMVRGRRCGLVCSAWLKTCSEKAMPCILLASAKWCYQSIFGTNWDRRLQM
jgi:hypothetical protein